MNPIHRRAFWLMLLFSSALVTHAQLTVVPDTEPQRVFAGDWRKVAVVFHNAGERTFEGAITAQVFQVTSATAAHLSDAPLKKLQILPGQTVVECAQLSFPEVMAETGFLVQWLEKTQRVLGKTEVRVFPTNLLACLRTLAGEMPLGLFDPADRLKPLLRSVEVPFQDLVEDDTDKFHGKLAIFGPFESKLQMRVGLDKQIGTLAKKGVAVVWIQAPPECRDVLTPSFYTVHEENGAVVVVQADLVAKLPERPQSQLNLVQFARLALHPEPVHLPHRTPQQ